MFALAEAEPPADAPPAVRVEAVDVADEAPVVALGGRKAANEVTLSE